MHHNKKSRKWFNWENLRDSVDGDVEVPELSVILDRSRSLQLPSSSWFAAPEGGNSWLQTSVSGTLMRPGVPHLLTAADAAPGPTPAAIAPDVDGPSPASESRLRPSFPRLSCLWSKAGSAVCWGLVMAEDGADRSQVWGHMVVIGTRPWSMAAGMAWPPTPTVWAGM